MAAAKQTAKKISIFRCQHGKMEASSHTTDPNFIFDDFEESEYMVTAKRSSTEYAFPEDEDLGDSWMNDDMVEMDTFARHHAQMAMSTLAVYPGATFPSHTSLSALPSQPTFDTINPSLNEMYYNSEDFTKETGAVVYDANEWYHMYGNDYQAHMGLNMTDQLHSA